MKTKEVQYLTAGRPADLQIAINALMEKDKRWRLVSVYHDGHYHTAWMEFEP